ncbi:hypothetical protein GJ496_001448 [Pomphorhynchus laevis]|nr:hypothetical protein GJ496_001448 [Pomphorhynchus laevis]
MADTNTDHSVDCKDKSKSDKIQDPLLEQFYNTIEQAGNENKTKQIKSSNNLELDDDADLQDESKIQEDIALSKDPTMNSAYQINRLLRPGSTYINLNPFAVRST